MVDYVKGLDAKRLYGISKSFANFLALTNSAEDHHRIRRLKAALNATKSPYGLWPKEDSCAGSIHRMVHQENISKDAIYDALTKQHIEIVLTAHPTEVNRRTMLRKHKRVRDILEQLDRPDLSQYERKNLGQMMRAEVCSIWESDSLRRSKPTPVDEARFGIAVVENCLWEAVPNFLRKLDDVVIHELGKPLPLTFAPIKISSWMGGDRDGNPNVTPEITYEVTMLSRWMAATMLKHDISELRASLSMQYCSEELEAHVTNVREPYREILKKIEHRLQSTIDWTGQAVLTHSKPCAVSPSVDCILSKNDILEPLLMIHESLDTTGLHAVANGELTDVIRRVAAFGVALMPLDIRQESGRHSEALDAITRYLGIGAYSQWDESTRRNWLQNELANRRPLMPRGVNYQKIGFSPTVIDTLRTFEVAASIHQESLGAYVISQCQQASDVLAVALLQQDAGMHPMRVVPLFETLDDLQRAPATVDALFSIPSYRGRIDNKHEIMVGYSDSAKDAGRIAASWEQYNSQLAMSEVAKKYGVEVTFFHGKGGTVGRGGNPALYKAILAHPPGTINGRFRVTEQGEMITQNLGQISVAERTLDLMTAGVLAERFIERPAVKREWRETMERLSDVSCKIYRGVVREEPRFVPYFRAATPELELSGLNVGSRPTKRNPKGGVESLRAIPWNFAWTQTRLNLPTWLGIGEAFAAEIQRDSKTLKEMCAQWPWFQTLVDLVEMILVKSDLYIAENYDSQLVKDPESIGLGRELRQKMAVTIQAVLEVSGNSQLQVNNPVLLRSLNVRNPYIDPLNVIQVEILRRLRFEEQLSQEDRSMLQDALLVTINGIANGMKNSG